MEERLQNDDAVMIDLGQVFQLLKKNIKFIVVMIVICMSIAFIGTTFLIPKKYASESSIYLVPNVNPDTGIVDYNALNVNAKQVNNYMYMIKGENILSEVAKDLGIKSVGQISSALSVSNTANTEIIKVSAVTNDPELSQKIVVTTISKFFEDVQAKLDIKNMTVLNEAKVNESPVSPNKKLYTIIGALMGLILSCGFVMVRFLLDKRLRTKAEAEKFLGIPVLVEIPFGEE